MYILKNVYSPKNYFNRCLKLGMVLTTNRKYRPSLAKRLKSVQAVPKLSVKLGLRPSTCYYFWRNIFVILAANPSSLEDVFNLMAMYIHFAKQTRFAIDLLSGNVCQGKYQDVVEQKQMNFQLKGRKRSILQSALPTRPLKPRTRCCRLSTLHFTQTKELTTPCSIFPGREASWSAFSPE